MRFWLICFLLLALGMTLGQVAFMILEPVDGPVFSRLVIWGLCLVVILWSHTPSENLEP